jgi:hypothetical protein
MPTPFFSHRQPLSPLLCPNRCGPPLHIRLKQLLLSSRHIVLEPEAYLVHFVHIPVDFT